MSRYFIRKNEAGAFEAVDSVTNIAVSPTCQLDMAALHSYYESTGRHSEAQEFLARICQGGRPVTELVESIGKPIGPLPRAVHRH